MVRTRVGYAGGETADPNYQNVGDHTETVQVDYDPARMTYTELLDFFWRSHNCSGPSGSGQYKRAVFYHDERQRKLALDSKAAMERELGEAVGTAVAPLRSFTMAENYHQKYYLKQHPLLEEMSRAYPRHRDLVDSTAAARLNGYLGRYGSREQLLKEIDDLGLSESGRETLLDFVD